MNDARPGSSITLSTKCWEGDYRRLLTRDGLEALFGPLDAAAPRQVVLNRILDTAAAETRAQALVRDGLLTAYAWAEDLWPAVAATLEIPLTWFGAAWPYSAPELCELMLASTDVVLHLAGDVRVAPGAPWAPRAVAALERWPEVAVVAPTTPSRSELTEPGFRRLGDGWMGSQLFSDQCFAARRAELLAPAVVRSVHPIAGRYPRPGGALTFEARVGAWLRTTGKWRATDETRDYLHPVSGTEGDSYRATAAVPVLLPPVPVLGSAFPAPRSVRATGVLLAHNQERTVASAVVSLSWCAEVVVLDEASSDRTAARAAEAGASVLTGGSSLLAEVLSRGDRIVQLNADEVVTAELAHVLAKAVTQGVGVDARVRVLERGRWTRAGSRPVLEPVAPGGRCRRTRAAVVRLGSVGLADSLARLNAETDRRAQGAVLDHRVGGRLALKGFFGSVRRGGGLRRAALDAVAEWLWAEKAWEATQGGPTAQQASHDEIAKHLIEGQG